MLQFKEARVGTLASNKIYTRTRAANVLLIWLQITPEVQNGLKFDNIEEEYLFISVLWHVEIKFMLLVIFQDSVFHQQMSAESKRDRLRVWF